MKIVFHTNSVSPHQLPLARELISRVGADNYRYIYTTPLTEERRNLGWSDESEPWIVHEDSDGHSCVWLEESDILISSLRDIDLFARRSNRRLKSFYMSERWFKPIFLGWRCWGVGITLPGWMRLYVPFYRAMVRQFVRWANGDSNARILAIGPWAKKDFLRMGVQEDRIVDWGYFVKPSEMRMKGLLGEDVLSIKKSEGVLRLLWCGRLLELKRVKDIVRAVGEYIRRGRGVVSLTIVGDGPEKARLIRMAEGLPITFFPSQPVDEIRKLMRSHDTFVFSSNQYEGWGAVVSEALEEGMNVIGTYEAGASAAVLPNCRLYHCGDVEALLSLITKEAVGELPTVTIDGWSAHDAALKMFNMIGVS